MLKKLELSESDHQEIYLECKKHGIEFMSTPFDNQSFDILKNIGIKSKTIIGRSNKFTFHRISCKT